MSIAGKQLKQGDFKSNGSDLYINKTSTGGNPGLLLIYANWCGHCNRFKPVFNEIAQQMGNKFPVISIEHAELEKNQKLMTDLDFQGYPTIKFFDQHGKILGDYNGDRDKKSILAHICNIYHHCIAYH